jgi:hypothetical protein
MPPAVEAPQDPTTDSTDPHHRRRWPILILPALAQLMVVLDTTVVNIALSSAQWALGFDNSDRPRIVTAYTFAPGSLLLLGGRFIRPVRT